MAGEREIIEIDEEKCDGCGACVPDCPEGALKIVDGKARLVADSLCDGLGACLGRCPRGAIRVTRRKAGDYDEGKVIANIAASGEKAVAGHLEHLAGHGQEEYLAQALAWLEKEKLPVPEKFRGRRAPVNSPAPAAPGGCPGSRPRGFPPPGPGPEPGASELRQWPVQLALVPPDAPFFRNAGVILAADCVPCAMPDFHAARLRGRALALACPKLDGRGEDYIEKIRLMADTGRIDTLTVMTMEVPCCRGLLEIAREGLGRAERRVPLKSVVVGLDGKTIREEWL